jgi:DNA-binding LytR/AlgR family response regulator
MHALIIEDNPIFQIRLRNLIEPYGFEVTEADSVDSAKNQLDNRKFDLLICDIILRGGTIFDVGQLPDVPIVFITASEDTVYMRKTLKVDKALFLVKPFSDLTIRASIMRLIGGNPNTFITVFGKNNNPIKIPCDQIEMIESEGNYSCILTVDNVKYVIKRSAKQLMSNIDHSVFLRIKRSTFVNKSKLINVSLVKSKVFTKNHELLVSRYFKKDIYEFHRLFS